MRKIKLLLPCLAVIVFALLLGSCKKSANSTTPAVSISDTSQTINESDGTVNITVALSEAPVSDVQLNYELTGTAILNGDYEVDSTDHLTVPAGSTSASLEFTIFDDAVVESDKTIHVKFTFEANVTFTNTEATIIINDNDVSEATNGLQTDLTWDAGSLVNLELYTANNVVINSDTIDSFDLVDGSENEKGFESLLINNNDPDDDYYLVVYYNTGSRTVNFTLTSNGPDVSDAITDDTFEASDTGAAVFYGPITKSGSSYSRQAGGNFDLGRMKSYVYHGKIRR